jgi:ribosome recycling factor
MVYFEEMEQGQVLDLLKQKLEKVLEIVDGDLATIRTGRAKPDLVGGLEVSAYGGRMKLFEVANISAPDPSLITVVPWDKSLIREIEKAINESQMQLSANVSGEMIRVPVPALTEERRKDFVKLLHQKMESGRVMVRQVRQDVKEEIEKMKKQSGVSEDDVERLLEELQKMTDDYMIKVEEMGKKKEAEIMEV